MSCFLDLFVLIQFLQQQWNQLFAVDLCNMSLVIFLWYGTQYLEDALAICERVTRYQWRLWMTKERERIRAESLLFHY